MLTPRGSQVGLLFQFSFLHYLVIDQGENGQNIKFDVMANI